METVRDQIGGQVPRLLYGPASNPADLEEAIEKLSARTRAIGSTKTAATVLVGMYKSRAITTLGYVMQLVPVPPSIKRKEKAVSHGLLHMANNLFHLHNFFYIGEVGAPKIRVTAALSGATHLRAAHETLNTWDEKVAWLDMESSLTLPLRRLLDGNPSPVCWDSRPIAHHVQEAAFGFPKSPWETPGKQVVRIKQITLWAPSFRRAHMRCL